jgi:hydroxymethylbilane synthase
MQNHTLRIATRNSPLALWQTYHVRDQLLHYWPDLTIEILPMTTSGDRFLSSKLLSIGGKGLFVKELEESMLKKESDCAVHSIKDVPTKLPDNLILNTICLRDNPFDALLSNKYSKLDDLPPNASIGTSSLRRQSQLLAYRPDLNIIPLRGNIQTRMSSMQTKNLDAIILAHAGLERMGLTHLIQETLSQDIMLPACGQGALGIECRQDDEITQQLLAPLNDLNTAICVQSERLVNELLGGNCHVPLAVYCHMPTSQQIEIQAKVASIDGQKIIKQNGSGAAIDAMLIANNCANQLLNNGAKELLNTN